MTCSSRYVSETTALSLALPYPSLQFNYDNVPLSSAAAMFCGIAAAVCALSYFGIAGPGRLWAALPTPPEGEATDAPASPNIELPAGEATSSFRCETAPCWGALPA